jgi:3-deoxy-manno-octulosonate cytidylyltransferase (CMP-KDO synthetase)
MIVHVLERAQAARNVSRVLVATDDERILEAVRAAGGEALMTGTHHASGSDRLAEVAATLNDADVIVNVQGDEPLISTQTIEAVVDEILNEDEAMIVTTCEKITEVADALNPNVVKVVVDRAGRALYFSRAPVPFPREAVNRHGTLEAALANEPALLTLFRKHTGLYAYRRSFLLEYTAWPQSTLERAESLEQLRALERGATIKVIEAHEPSIGVDTMEDLERVRKMFGEQGRATSDK